MQKGFMKGMNVKGDILLKCNNDCWNHYINDGSENDMVSTFVKDIDIHKLNII